MATVYLAKDRKHERQVADKVLRPDLAAALGPGPFLREVKIAANRRRIDRRRGAPATTNRPATVDSDVRAWPVPPGRLTVLVMPSSGWPSASETIPSMAPVDWAR